jgi:hypothetical protein
MATSVAGTSREFVMTTAETGFGFVGAAMASPLVPEAYEGRYANPYVGEAIVKREAEGLVLKVGPGEEKTTALHHFNCDLFLTYPGADMPEMPSEVRFSIGPDSRATAVTIDFLDGSGVGTLRRVP